MPRKKAHKDYFTFVKGLNTESSPLNFPDNFSLDEENFDLFVDGSRRKRLGIDYESAALLSATGDAPNKCVLWDAPGGDATKQFIVTQRTNYLYFHQINGDGTYTYIGSATLAHDGTAGADLVYYSYFDVAFGNGYLFVCHPYTKPCVIEYDPTAAAGSQISPYYVVINVRDFDGIYDGTAVTDKPTGTLQVNKDSVSGQTWDAYKYNILNQGWNTANVTTYGSPYPSRAMTMYSGKNKTPNLATPSNYDVWSAAYQDLTFQNATPAPTGHFILENINKGRSTVLANDANNTSSWVIDTDWNDTAYAQGTTYLNYYSSVAFFAGRAWWSGINYAPLVGEVYFSQIIGGQTLQAVADRAGSCYQEADPTSENISDLIATDGGVIKIPDAGNIIKMIPTRASLLCFSERGVWEISGGQGGFSATDFRIRKVTSYGTGSKESIISVGSSILYCGLDGIIEISPNQYTGQLEAQNVSTTTIQSLYMGIPTDNRQYIKGDYDYHTNKIYWLYYDGSAYPTNTNGDQTWFYNRALIYDLNVKAFYKYHFEHLTSTADSRVELSDSNWATSPFIIGLFVPNYSYTVGNNYNDNQNRYVRFVALSKEGSNWAFYPCLLNDTNFVDWNQVSSGTPVFAYLDTGYDAVGDASKKKQIDYLTMYFNRTEQNFVDDGSGNAVFDNPSGCLLKSKWEWSDSSSSGKWGRQRQVYRFKREYTPSGTLPEAFEPGFAVIATKDKVRGSGRSLVLRMDTEEGKDCWIAGWAIDYTMDGNT